MTDKTVLDQMDKKMQSTLADAKHKLAAVRTGRASLAMFDGVHVDYYGTPTPLNQVAKLSIPEAALVVAQPFDPSALVAIEKAILSADLGLNPSNDGKLIRVPIPPLTEERRKQLVKKVHGLGEDEHEGDEEQRVPSHRFSQVELLGSGPADEHRVAPHGPQLLAEGLDLREAGFAERVLG